MDVDTGDKSQAQLVKAYGVHPNTVGFWKSIFMEQGPELFAKDNVVSEYGRRIADLEQLIGKKEVEIAPLERLPGADRMTTEQKVALMEGVWETYGLRPALEAVDLPRSTWYYHQKHKVDYEEKYADLKPVLEQIALDHPEYGVPRIMPELRDAYDVRVNHLVIGRLLGIWELSILRSAHRPKPSAVQRAIAETGDRGNLVAQMDHIGLFEVVCTDFTEVFYADGRRKAFLIPIIAHRSKIAYGWAVGESADTTLALQAWEQAKDTLRRLSIPHLGMIMHHHQDSVFTGYKWTHTTRW